jgi:hypothetical protein
MTGGGIFGFQPGRSSGVVDTSNYISRVLLVQSLVRNSIAAAYRGTAQETGENVEERVKLNTNIFDIGKNFDLVNGYYVAPVTGWYQCNGNILIQTTAEGVILCHIRVNEALQVQGGELTAKGAGFYAITVAGVVFAAAGQHIELSLRTTLKAQKLNIAGDRNQLSIYLVAPE